MVDAIAPRDRDMLLDINMALNSLHFKHFKGLLNESIFGMGQQAGWFSIQITSIVFWRPDLKFKSKLYINLYLPKGKSHWPSVQ